MKTNVGSLKKISYSTPSIVTILLDNEISLILQSYDPPGDPGLKAMSPDYFDDYPFGNNIG